MYKLIGINRLIGVNHKWINRIQINNGVIFSLIIVIIIIIRRVIIINWMILVISVTFNNRKYRI